jgi:hypothetical protein
MQLVNLLGTHSGFPVVRLVRQTLSFGHSGLHFNLHEAPKGGHGALVQYICVSVHTVPGLQAVWQKGTHALLVLHVQHISFALQSLSVLQLLPSHTRPELTSGQVAGREGESDYTRSRMERLFYFIYGGLKNANTSYDQPLGHKMQMRFSFNLTWHKNLHVSTTRGELPLGHSQPIASYQ